MRERERESRQSGFMIFSHKTLSTREDEPSPLISPLRPPRFESATRFQRNALRDASVRNRGWNRTKMNGV